MKKIFLLLTFALALTSAATNITTGGNQQLKKQAATHPNGVAVDQPLKFMNEPGKANKTKFTASNNKRPSGTMKAYNRYGGAIIYNGETGVWACKQSGNAYVIFGDDGKVYLRNPIYGINLNYDFWVEGTLNEDGTKITVPMGQTMYEEGGNELVLCWGSTKLSYGSDLYKWCDFTIDESVDEVVYTIEGDCIYLEGTEGDATAAYPDNYTMTGLSAVWAGTTEWCGFLDCGTEYIEGHDVNFPKMINEQPEGELVEYLRYGESITRMMLYEQSGKLYVVYGTDGKVYLKNPIYGLPVFTYERDCWMEGTLSADGKTITMPMDQYVYWNWNDEHGIMLKNLTLDVDAEGYVTLTINEDVTEMTFTIDGNTLTLDGTSGDMYADWPTSFTGLGGVWDIDELPFATYLDWNTYFLKVVPAVPADPSLDEAETGYVKPWYDCGDESGRSVFRHHIKLEDVDGNPLDAEHVTYTIFTDDQPYTFTAWPPYIPEDTDELPYNLYLDYVSPDWTYFARTNAEGYEPLFTTRIGIQVYYTVNGVRNASHIRYYYLVPTYVEYGVPANPTADKWYDSGNENGYSRFFYTVSKYTTDGEPMDPNRIYFSIFTDDDQLFTYDASKYTHDFQEDVTLVPYNHIGVDVRNTFSYIYRTNAEGYDPFFNHQIGIQSYYLCDNGEMTASDIIYLEVFEPVGAIDEVNAGKTVAGVKYYNMAGQQMSEPNGICIAVTTYTDGTASAVKVVR